MIFSHAVTQLPNSLRYYYWCDLGAAFHWSTSNMERRLSTNYIQLELQWKGTLYEWSQFKPSSVAVKGMGGFNSLREWMGLGNKMQQLHWEMQMLARCNVLSIIEGERCTILDVLPIHRDNYNHLSALHLWTDCNADKFTSFSSSHSWLVEYIFFPSTLQVIYPLECENQV